MLKEINSIKLPNQLKELIIHDGVNLNDEAYRYHITDMDNGKQYHGYHVDTPKIYWHSCENKEFQKIFSNPNSNLKYEIVASGSKKSMQAQEKKYLTKNNASKSEKFWNGNNGITFESEVDFDLIKNIISKVQNGEYPITRVTKDSIKGDVFKQVRVVEFVPGQVKMIADEIDKMMGDTSECEPLIYLEDYFHEGNDCGIGGNHTHKGFIKSKHGTEIDKICIPKKDWEALCENGIHALGLGLNPKLKIEKTPTTEEDAIKYCLNLHDSGKEWWTKDVKSYLKDIIKFKNISKIEKGVNDELKKLERRSKKGLVFRTYDKDSQYHQELLDKVNSYTTNEVYCVAYSSATVDLERLVSGAGDKKTIVCIVHHPTPSAEDTWNNTDLNKYGSLPYCKKRIENSIKWFNGNTTVKFIEMEAWVPDTK